jgi:hypothetical protein
VRRLSSKHASLPSLKIAGQSVIVVAAVVTWLRKMEARLHAYEVARGLRGGLLVANLPR